MDKPTYTPPEPAIHAAPVGQERWPFPKVGYFTHDQLIQAHAAGLAKGRSEAASTQWQRPAIAWLRWKAADQAQTNEKYPRHAKAYPSWVQRVETAQRLADELEADAEAAPFGLEPWQVAAGAAD